MEIHLENLDTFFRERKPMIEAIEATDPQLRVYFEHTDQYIVDGDFIKTCTIEYHYDESPEMHRKRGCMTRHYDVDFEVYHFYTEESVLPCPPFEKADLERFCTEALESEDWKLFASLDRMEHTSINPESFLVFNPVQLKIFLILYGEDRTHTLVQLEIHTHKDTFYQSLDTLIWVSQSHKGIGLGFPEGHYEEPQIVYDITPDKLCLYREVKSIGQLITFRKDEVVKYWLQNYPPYWIKGAIQDFKFVPLKRGGTIPDHRDPILDSRGVPIRRLLPFCFVKVNNEWVIAHSLYKESYFTTETTDFIDTLVEQRVELIGWDQDMKILKTRKKY